VHLLPIFGELPAAAITTDMLAAFIAARNASSRGDPCADSGEGVG